jgi:hypothetical protein
VNRFSRCLLLGWLVSSAVAAPAARVDSQEPPPPASPPPAALPPATPTPKDPLEEFVPKEKVKADSAVAFPVDI